MNDNTLIENAILAFLHNYPDHQWNEGYKILLEKLEVLKKNEQSTDTTVQKRGRPAKRQRKKETSSVEVSEEKS